jgi:hypothetical protein
MASAGPVLQLLTTALSLVLLGGCCGSLLERQALSFAASKWSADLVSGGFAAGMPDSAPALMRAYRPLQTDELLVAATALFLLVCAPTLNVLVVLVGCFVPSLATAATLCREIRPSTALRERALAAYKHSDGGGGSTRREDAAAADPEAAACASDALRGGGPLLVRDSVLAYTLVALRALTQLAGMWRPRLLLPGVATLDDPLRAKPLLVMLRWMTLTSALLCELPLLVISVALLMFGREVAPTTDLGPSSMLQQASIIVPGAAFTLQLWHVFDSLSALASTHVRAEGGSRLFSAGGSTPRFKSEGFLSAADEQDVVVRGGWGGVGAAPSRRFG